MATNQNRKIRALQEAIRQWESSPETALVDEEQEEALKPFIAHAQRLINHRPRSVYELRSRLAERDAPDELIDLVIERCERGGMVNDAAFAREWVRQRSEHQKKSVAVLRRELEQKGVAGPLIEDALQQISQEDQLELIESLVRKKASQVSKVPQGRDEYNKVLRRIVGVAARRGFPSDASMRAARAALDGRIDELS